MVILVRLGTNRNTNQPSLFVWEGTNQLLSRSFVNFYNNRKKIYFKHGALAFQEMPLGIFGGPEKDREFVLLVGGLFKPSLLSIFKPAGHFLA